MTIFNIITAQRVEEINAESLIKKTYKKRKVGPTTKEFNKAPTFNKESLEERLAYPAKTGVKELFEKAIAKSLSKFVSQISNHNTNKSIAFVFEITSYADNELKRHKVDVQELFTKLAPKHSLSVLVNQDAYTWEPISESIKRPFLPARKPNETAMTFIWRIPALKRSYAEKIEELHWIEARKTNVL